MTNFEEMTPIQKLDHIEKCMAEAHKDVLELTYLADILDVWDYWFPYLLGRLREIEK
jgi:hypothetical protein